MKATTPTRRLRKPLIHTIATKLEAVKQVNMLIAAGVTKYNACNQLAKKHHVTTQTVYNWCSRHNTKLTQVTRNNGNFETLNATPSFQREDGKFAIHSLSIRTVGGAIVKLTPADIKGIAEYATIV